jgi:DNA-binding MarR family transcriptional regulator
MSVKLSATELRTWQRLQVVTESLRREVGRGLHNDAGLSGSEFTVLTHLVAVGGEARPARCARAIGWDSSRLAHQLGRLDRRGLIDRVSVDGRGASPSLIRLTDAGRAAHRAAVGPHLRAAKTWFADGLSGRQMLALSDALETLQAHIESLAAPAPHSLAGKTAGSR